jgi:hypothetical protein
LVLNTFLTALLLSALITCPAQPTLFTLIYLTTRRTHDAIFQKTISFTILNVRLPQKKGNFFTSCVTSIACSTMLRVSSLFASFLLALFKFLHTQALSVKHYI